MAVSARSWKDFKGLLPFSMYCTIGVIHGKLSKNNNVRIIMKQWKVCYIIIIIAHLPNLNSLNIIVARAMLCFLPVMLLNMAAVASTSGSDLFL